MRTPLTVIRMQTQLLLRRARAEPLEPDAVVEAITQIDRQAVIIGRCLDREERRGAR